MTDSGEKDLLLPKRLFATDCYPIGRLNVYSNANFLCSIRKSLKNSKEWKLLMKSCFGRLFAIPVNKLSVSAKLIHALICRQVITKKKYEMWTVFGGQPLRFSMREFSSVTGLPCHDFPEGYDTDIDTATEPVEGGYWDKLLGAGMEPTLDDVAKKMSETQDMSMKLRLALLLIVDGILIARHQNQRPTPKYVEMLADIESFLAFPWGRESFLQTIADMTPRKKYTGKQGNSRTAFIKQLQQHSRRLVGFPIALQLLAYQNIPELLSAMVDTSDLKSLVECRILKIQKQSSSIRDVQAVEEAENLVVVPLIDEVEDEDDMCDLVDFEGEKNDAKVDYLLEKIGTGHKFMKSEWHGGHIVLRKIVAGKNTDASKVVKHVVSGKRKEVAESALTPEKNLSKRKRNEVTENFPDNDSILPSDIDERLAALEKEVLLVKSENAKLEARSSKIERHLKTFRLGRKRQFTILNNLVVNKKKSCRRGPVKVGRKPANPVHISHKKTIRTSREILEDSVDKDFEHNEENDVDEMWDEIAVDNGELKKHSIECLGIEAMSNQIGVEDGEKTVTTEEIKEDQVFNKWKEQDASNGSVIIEENKGVPLDGLGMDIDLNKVEAVITQDDYEGIENKKEFDKDGEMAIDLDGKQEENISDAVKMHIEDFSNPQRNTIRILAPLLSSPMSPKITTSISESDHCGVASEVEIKDDEGFMAGLMSNPAYDKEIKHLYDVNPIESISFNYGVDGELTNREMLDEVIVSDEEDRATTEYIELSDSSPTKPKDKSYLSVAEKELVVMFARKKQDDLTIQIMSGQSNLLGQVDDNEFHLWKQTLLQSRETVHDTHWGYEFDNNFLLQLSEAKQWVSHLHIEVLGSLITRMYSTTLSTKGLAFVSPWFANCLQGNYNIFSQACNKKKFHWPEHIKKSVTFEESQWFAHVHTIYMPMIWDYSHWVGIVISLRNWTVEILDPNTDLYCDRKVKKFIAPVVEMLPYIIDKFCTPNASQANDIRPFVWEREKSIYKNIRSGDCGPVCMKFLEIHCNGGSAMDLARITDRDVDTFRKQYALDIYTEMVVPLYASN